jgi:hypothetical protein
VNSGSLLEGEIQVAPQRGTVSVTAHFPAGIETHREKTMVSVATDQRETRTLIASDKGKGTEVYGADGQHWEPRLTHPSPDVLLRKKALL